MLETKSSTPSPLHRAAAPQTLRSAALQGLALLAILALGAAFRFYNVNWDKDTYHIHPDERHTAMVITAIQWPESLADYFDTSHTLLNPRNVDKAWFYGTLPLFLTKYVATLLNRTGYDEIHLVGRVLSGIFDLGSVLLLYFFARRLFGRRAGLLASFLLALTALNIQGSHYFVVDTFLTFFVLLTLWFTLGVAEGQGWRAYVGLGLAMGFTLACKVSVFLLVAVVALGAWLWVRRQARESRAEEPASPALPTLGALLLRAIAGLAVAALIALAVFRVAQPYAWAGPNYDQWDMLGDSDPLAAKIRLFQRIPEPVRAVLMPNPRWIADIVSAGAQQTGEADMPWGRQWTDRTPWLYPLDNMVRWGMGVPLGVAAWLGVAYVLWQLVRGWRARRGEEGAAERPERRRDLVLIPLAWVLLSFFWQGMQFVKSIRYFLPIYPLLAAFAAYLVIRSLDWAKARHWGARLAAGAWAGFVLLGTLAWAWALLQIYREPITRVQASRWIYENIERGATLANEHFDDPLPFNLDGRVAFGGGVYNGLDLTLYDEDTPEKLEKLLEVLNQTDYIIMSSGRLWQSIPRLPMRYPVTTRYYELLFAEELGFEKAAEFHSYPRLFGIEFDDTWAEEQFTVYDHPKVLIYRKTAEYDGERVRAMLSAGIDWGQIAHWLNPRDLPEWRREQARQQRTQGGQNALMLTEAQWQVQRGGGTWASLFDLNSVANRWPILSWLFLLAGIGLLALPLTVGIFARLPDRGYILARPVGVLLVAWLSWSLTNLTALHYSRGTILLALGLVAAGSGISLLFARPRRALLDLVRKQGVLVLVNEFLFLFLFGVFLLIRWGNPDLWHPWMGGEKPMDLAYLNAVIKSTEFPPYDPWFAGGYLNYYYFGQVMVGTLIKLAGIAPAVAYNLVIPLWFAMTAMGAFSVVYNLVAGTRTPMGAQPGAPTVDSAGEQRRPCMTALLCGLAGALFVAVLGNLGQVHLLLLKAAEGVMETFKSTIPGLVGLVRVVVGSLEVIFGGKALPIGINEWYWNASRLIPAAPMEAVINEFPFFTFLYADLHAHLIAFPLTFVSLSVALMMVLAAQGGEGAARRQIAPTVVALLLWSVTIGAMRTTNTWDVPPHLLIVLGSLVLSELARRGRLSWRLAGTVAWQFGLVFLLSWSILYRPFWANYGSFYNSVAVWTGTRTPVWAYLLIHGLFFFVLVSTLCARVLGLGSDGRRPADPLIRRLALTWRFRERQGRLREVAAMVGVRGLPLSLPAVWLGIGLLILVELLLVVPGLLPFTRPQADALAVGGYANRSLAVVALGIPVGLLGLMLLLRRGLSATERLWTTLVLLGLAMSVGVELVVIEGDIARMNTVFKFYLQVWLIWGVTAAAALAWLVPRLRYWQQGKMLWLGLLATLLFCAGLYPPLAAKAKVNDRFNTDLGPGLDGWAYMQAARYQDPEGGEYDLKWDLEAIRWLLDNVVGSPVILEGHTPEYRWGARYSVNTGLPAVVGWNWHQRQQRAAADTQAVWDRVADVAMIYKTPAPEVALPLLEQYQVRYIVVGPLERTYYEPQGLAKLEEMARGGALQVVFRNEQVTIYEVAAGR